MIEDYEACRRPWGFDPAQVTGEVSVWHGLADPLVPAAHGRRLAEALPHCTTFLEPGAGHFFFGERLSEIIGPLVEDASTAEPDLRLAA